MDLNLTVKQQVEKAMIIKQETKEVSMAIHMPIAIMDRWRIWHRKWMGIKW
jgi:hypothetical protein